MRFRRIFTAIACLFVFMISASSCATIEAYQRAKLNDRDMELNNRNIEEFESNFQSYKEGAVGGNNGNGGAGCGCN